MGEFQQQVVMFLERGLALFGLRPSRFEDFCSNLALGGHFDFNLFSKTQQLTPQTARR
jgi:hypothetical protein